MNANKKDLEMLRGIQRGNKEMLSRLFYLYQDELFTYGYAITKNREIIKDSIQDLFLDIWNRRERIPDVILLKPYLLKAFRRILLRKIKNDMNHPALYNYEFDEIEPSPEEYLMQIENNQSQRDYFSQKIALLPSRQKEIIYLRYYQDLSYDKIADIMDISPQAAWNLISRALKKLKSLIRNKPHFFTIIPLAFQMFINS